MKTYLLTAAGVIFISVIVSLLIPEGKLNKSITFIMRIICLVVLIQPLSGIFKLGDTQSSSDYFDYEYVTSVYSEHQGEQLEKLLNEKFKTQTDCVVKVVFDKGEFKVTDVEVATEEISEKLFKEIYSYLKELGYINITVYAQST